MPFDPDSFLDSDINSELDTQFVPVPEGEYAAIVDDVTVKVTTSGYTILNVKWSLDDAAVAAETGRDTNNVIQSVFLDITSTGQLDTAKGKNIRLGKLRDVFDQNMAGQSLRAMIGRNAIILVTHREGDDGAVYTDVKSVTAA